MVDIQTLLDVEFTGCVKEEDIQSLFFRTGPIDHFLDGLSKVTCFRTSTEMIFTTNNNVIQNGAFPAQLDVRSQM